MKKRDVGRPQYRKSGMPEENLRTKAVIAALKNKNGGRRTYEAKTAVAVVKNE